MKVRNIIALSEALEDGLYTTTGLGFDHNTKAPDLTGELGLELLDSIGDLMKELGGAVCAIKAACREGAKAEAAKAGAL